MESTNEFLKNMAIRIFKLELEETKKGYELY